MYLNKKLVILFSSYGILHSFQVPLLNIAIQTMIYNLPSFHTNLSMVAIYEECIQYVSSLLSTQNT